MSLPRKLGRYRAQDLAYLLGLPIDTLRSYSQGRLKIPTDVRINLAALCDYTPSELEKLIDGCGQLTDTLSHIACHRIFEFLMIRHIADFVLCDVDPTAAAPILPRHLVWKMLEWCTHALTAIDSPLKPAEEDALWKSLFPLSLPRESD